MKKILLLIVMLAAGSILEAGGVSIILEGMHNKCKLLQPEGLPVARRLSGEKKEMYIDFYDATELPLTWKAFSVSFVPEKSGSVIITVSGTYNPKKGMANWTEYDKFEVENGVLMNPSFEQLNIHGEFYVWRYYTKTNLKKDQKDAADGKNYVTVNRSQPARQTIRVTAGKKVTIKFMARNGGMSPAEAPSKYASSQNAPLAK